MTTTLHRPPLSPLPDIVDDLTRRQFVIGDLSMAACWPRAATTNDRRSAVSEWAVGFTDDRGEMVSLAAPPERVVAYIGTAAALWDVGVRSIVVMGT